MTPRDHLWAIVLAGGEGQRLRALTRIPKQFYSFGERGSMLRWALDRAARLVPRERIVPLVVESHRPHWEKELEDLPPRNLAIQPRGRGTAVGILLALRRILSRDPLAFVVTLPSDHHVEDEEELERTLLSAVSAVHERPWRAVLVGTTPDGPEADYGWILPAPTGEGPAHHIAGFVEKPGVAVATALLRAGALWNTFMLAASATTLLELLESAAPKLVQALDGTESDQDLRRAYADLSELDFSRDVLERVVNRLSVLRLPACGWTDLGTPRRLVRHLAWREHAYAH